jgi:DNA polymerase-3 subunit epsilon/oligoribonuclease
VIGIFLDTETNGLNAQVHKILEIAFKFVDLNTGTILHSYQSLIAQPLQFWKKSDPTSLSINGFTWEEIQKGKAAQHVSQDILDLFATYGIKRKKAVFICQNPSFDRIYFSQLIDVDTQEMLQWPYHWLDLASMFWALSMEKAKQGLGPAPWEIGCSKDTIAAYCLLPPEEKPHRAMNGVEHLLLCYQSVVGFPHQ